MVGALTRPAPSRCLALADAVTWWAGSYLRSHEPIGSPQPRRVNASARAAAAHRRAGGGARSGVEVETLLQHVEDDGIRDFIAWGFRTGMRKGEIAQLTWDMLDRSGTPWVLRIAAAITKNRTGRTLGLEGEVRAIIERRLKVRRFDTPLIFHRKRKGKPGQPITDFWDVWRNALRNAGLPSGRLFHDLRRSAVRTLIRAGVDETTAMKVSGHKTRSMLLRYNIVTERESADALRRADAYLQGQPQPAEREKGQLKDIRPDGAGKSLTRQRGVGSSGRIRTENPPSTPADPEQLELDLKRT